MSNTTTDPKKQLETLAAHQQEFEIFLHALTGLNVQVSLCVHSADNSVANLIRLLDAGKALPDFKQERVPNKTWVTHTDPNRHITVFMPDGFDTADLYPEPEDLEGYRSAVETANARQLLSPEDKAIEAASRRAEGQLKRNDDEIPF